jgi:hypothetical protein
MCPSWASKNEMVATLHEPCRPAWQANLTNFIGMIMIGEEEPGGHTASVSREKSVIAHTQAGKSLLDWNQNERAIRHYRVIEGERNLGYLCCRDLPT